MFKCMPVQDIFSRYVLDIEVQFSITSANVISVLEGCFDRFGIPRVIRTDQGPEFRSRTFDKFIKQYGIRHEFTDKGSPWQNGNLESFNGKFRDECLSRNIFENLTQAREVIKKHLSFYNTNRPHSMLCGKTPVEVYGLGS